MYTFFWRGSIRVVRKRQIWNIVSSPRIRQLCIFFIEKSRHAYKSLNRNNNKNSNNNSRSSRGSILYSKSSFRFLLSTRSVNKECDVWVFVIQRIQKICIYVVYIYVFYISYKRMHMMFVHIALCMIILRKQRNYAHGSQREAHNGPLGPRGAYLCQWIIR